MNGEMDGRTGGQPARQIRSDGGGRRGAEGRGDARGTVRERRFVCCDGHVHGPLGNHLDVRGKNDQERRKRAGRLREANLVYPDDIFIDIRHFGAVMVVMGDLVIVTGVRREVTMGEGRVIGRMRLVHVLPWDHG